ncbi:MAG: hypothetical protein V1792_03960 [Pseudomonadota bacterium]
MPLVKVGMPFIQGLAGIGEETRYNYTPGGHTLILSVDRPDRGEIEAVQGHEAVFGLLLKEETLFIPAKFGRLPWSASYYNWWINAPVMRPDPWHDLHGLTGGIPVTVCLVNASNCILEALRTVTLSHEFSRELLKTVCAQTRSPFDPWRHAKVAGKVSAGFAGGRAGMMKDLFCMCTASGKRAR